MSQCLKSPSHTFDSLASKASQIENYGKSTCSSETSHCKKIPTPVPCTVPRTSNSWYLWFGFIVLIIIIGLIIWNTCPDYFYKDDQCDAGSIILWSVGIALILIFLFWLIGGRYF